MLESLLVSNKKKYADNVIFLGEVTTNELITGNWLSGMMGLYTGTAQHSWEPWLQWEIDGKIVLYSKKPYRHSVSWDQLNTSGIVSDTQKIVLHGKEYWIGLPKGVNPDPSAPFATGYDVPYSHNSEWNRLMYPITVATAQNPKLSQVGPNQASYTETELVLVSAGGNGYYQWCRETSKDNATYRVVRGGGGVSDLNRGTSSRVSTDFSWRPRLELIGDALPAGIFLGEVPVSELISGDALASLVGVNAGTVFNSNEPWLKWEIDGKVVYYAKKPYRHSVSWNHLNNAGVVSDTRTITIQGKQYKIGLPKGLNPATGIVRAGGGWDIIDTHNSEWNRLMYPITVATAQDPKLSQVGPNQANYSDVELMLVPEVTNGFVTWCREASNFSGQYIRRGNAGVTRLDAELPTANHVSLGWRPRLELV